MRTQDARSGYSCLYQLIKDGQCLQGKNLFQRGTHAYHSMVASRAPLPVYAPPNVYPKAAYHLTIWTTLTVSCRHSNELSMPRCWARAQVNRTVLIRFFRSCKPHNRSVPEDSAF